jgi:hypothetical protein
MALDIRGSLKNTKRNKNYYVVVDELFSNAIDSYLIRKSFDSGVSGLKVVFSVEFFNRDLDGNAVDLKISCTDNGAGLGNEQTKAFITKDTSYKDDLSINGIGKCKGSGRIQFLHYFKKLKINSVYKDGDEYKSRKLSIDESAKEIDENSFEVLLSDSHETKTEITLDIVKPEIYESVFAGKNLKDKFSGESLKNHLVVTFLHRLVSLKDSLGDFTISFNTKHGDIEDEISLTRNELPDITAQKQINIYYRDSNGQPTSQKESFNICHYKLEKTKFRLKRNTVALCAKSSAVQFITKRYLKTKSLENNDVNGFYHIILVQSDYLDSHVNEQRDNFDIPNSPQQSETFLSKVLSMDEIFSEIESPITDFLAPPDWDKEEIVIKVGSKYGISPSMVTEAKVRIHYGDTEESVVKRVLTSYQEQIIKDTSEIFDIKEEITKSVPNSDEFRSKINELAWKYTASLKSVDMANLSQIVVRRAAILEVLHMAINKNLTVQTDENVKKREDEEIIHSIFFPMRKDSNEVQDHDIWILNEEYHYYDYISSDKPLSKISWGDNQLLFDADIDEELKKILDKNYKDNKAKRPDIAIFNKQGSAIIIEFKSPGINLDEHTADLMEYSVLLSAKSNGKLKKFYGYLIGTDVNPNRLQGYKKFPSGQGWFNTEKIVEHNTDKPLGELYSEILFYEDIVDRAKTQLDVYKKRLDLKID